MRATSESNWNCTGFFSRVETPVSSYICIPALTQAQWLRCCYRTLQNLGAAGQTSWAKKNLKLLFPVFKDSVAATSCAKVGTHPLVLNQSWCYWNELLQLKCRGNRFPPVSLKHNIENVHGPLLIVRELCGPKERCWLFWCTPRVQEEFIRCSQDWLLTIALMNEENVRFLTEAEKNPITGM